MTLRRFARPVVLIAVGIWLLAFIPRLASVGMPSSDEPAWLARSDHYATAYLDLDFGNAAAASAGSKGTMPGITTVIVGATGEKVWSAARHLGFVEDDEPFGRSRSGLFISQALMAAASAGLIVVLWWVLSRWIGRRVATIAAVLLAAEPFVVLHGARLTTDSFQALFGAIGAFALCATLGVPRRDPNPRARRVLAVLAGVGLAGAFASKVAALTLGPFVLLVLIVALDRDRRRGRGRELVTTLLVAVGSGLIFLAVTWPALWADPGGQLALLRRSSSQVGISRTQFFRGEATNNPGPLFYPYVLAYRSTPWLYLGALVTPLLVIARSTRAHTVLVLGYCVTPFVAITVATLKYDRYSLPLWPAIAILSALALDLGFRAVTQRRPKLHRPAALALAALLAFVWLSGTLVNPDAAAYANPLLGGGPAAARQLIVGGAAVSRAGEIIQDREGEHCDRVRIYATAGTKDFRFPCGRVVDDVAVLEPGDYVVYDQLVSQRGGGPDPTLTSLGPVVERIERRGVHVTDIIQVR
jgi:hypothetical protein